MRKDTIKKTRRKIRKFQRWISRCGCAVCLIILISITWSLVSALLVYPMGWNVPAASQFYYEAMNQGDADKAIYWAKRVVYNEKHQLPWNPIAVFFYVIDYKNQANSYEQDGRGEEYLRKAYKLKSDLEQSREQEKNAKPGDQRPPLVSSFYAAGTAPANSA